MFHYGHCDVRMDNAKDKQCHTFQTQHDATFLLLNLKVKLIKLCLVQYKFFFYMI